MKTFHATSARNGMLFDEVDHEVNRHQAAEAHHEGFLRIRKEDGGKEWAWG
jgi:hypothetical protein